MRHSEADHRNLQSGAAQMHFENGAFSDRVLAWYDRHRRILPWRTQSPCDPYGVWISEIMLQQTTVTAVIPYYERFLAHFPTVHHLAHADSDSVLTLWQGLGYYRRAHLLHQAAQIIATHGFPTSHQGWLDLPGIGPYTAGAIWTIAYNQPAVAVDGNILRVLSRWAGIAGPLWKQKTQQQAQVLLPLHRWGDYTQALMDLGSRVCRPQTPSCQDCPVQTDCVAYRTGMPSAFPPKIHRSVARRRGHVLVCVALPSPHDLPLEKNGAQTCPEICTSTTLERPQIQQAAMPLVYVCKHSPHQLLQGLWTFPTTPWHQQNAPESAPHQPEGVAPWDSPWNPWCDDLNSAPRLAPLWAFCGLPAHLTTPQKRAFAVPAPQCAGWVRHTFTHFHLELQVWIMHLPLPHSWAAQVCEADMRWQPLDRLDDIAMSTLMRKVQKLFLKTAPVDPMMTHS